MALITEKGIKYYIMMILYWTYVYDAVRAGFIEPRKERLRKLLESEKSKEDGDRDIDHCKLYRKLPGRGSKKSALKSKWTLRYFYSKRFSLFRDKERPEDQSQEVGSRIRDLELPTDDQCPLPTLPRFMRYYQYFSTAYILYSIIRYSVVSLITYNIIEVNPIYSCYLPGRLSFIHDLTYELPAISWLIIFFHVIYRYYSFFILKPLNMDCFIFVLQSEEFVRSKEIQLERLNKYKNSFQGEWIYLKDMMYYQCIKLGSNETEYLLKPNRTVKCWLRMTKFIRLLILIGFVNFMALSIFLLYIVLDNLLSNEYFDENYPHCRSFSNRAVDGNFYWTFSDPYRSLVFCFDMFDNGILLIDTASAMSWTFATAIICCFDISGRLSRICNLLEDCKVELISLNHNEKSRVLQPIHVAHIKDDDRKNQSRSLETRIRILQHEIIDSFDQIGDVDKFISKYSALVILIWFSMNIAYHLLAWRRKKLLMANVTVQFLQVIGLSAITFAFSNLARTHNITIRLYKIICSLMTYDQCLKTTRTGWTWVLEYYHESVSRHTLHIGPISPLTMINYLKGVARFASVAAIIIELNQMRGL